MRKKRNSQCSLDLISMPHEIHDILTGVSHWLDAHPEFVDWVYEDLRSDACQDTGRPGLSAESVLRIAFLRQFLQFDYEYLASFSEQALYDFTHHNRVLKKEASSCSYERKKDVKEKSYKKLLKLARNTKQRLIEASYMLKNACNKGECMDVAPLLNETAPSETIVFVVVSEAV